MFVLCWSCMNTTKSVGKSGHTSRLYFPEDGQSTRPAFTRELGLAHSIPPLGIHPSSSIRPRTLLPPQKTWSSGRYPMSFVRPRPRLQYSSGQMEAAIADVQSGQKSVRTASKEHGVPLRSLYHRLKLRSIKRTPGEKLGSAPAEEPEDH